MSNQSTQTDLNLFIDTLDGGVLREAIQVFLSQLALATRETGRASKLALNFEIKPMSGNEQMLTVKHDVKFTRPTSKGAATENRKSETPFYVGKGGKMSNVPEKEDLFASDKITPIIHKKA